MLHNAILIIHVILSISLVGLVLIQQGKGADMGAAFGSGASNTVFGSQGSASFITRATGIIAALFFVTSLSLAFLVTSSTTGPVSATDSLPDAEPTVEILNTPKSDTVIPGSSPAVSDKEPSSSVIPAEKPAKEPAK